MITIKGIEFDVDMTDTDVLERLEEAAETIQKKVKAEQAKNQKGSQTVKRFNELTEEFVDTILGEGASEELFGGRKSMTEHMKVYQGIFEAKDAALQEIAAITDAFNSKYSPNRATRRAMASKGSAKS